MAVDERLIDKRVVRRHLERGRLDADAYRGMLDALRDASDNVQRHESAAPQARTPSEQSQQS